MGQGNGQLWIMTIDGKYGGNKPFEICLTTTTNYAGKVFKTLPKFYKFYYEKVNALSYNLTMN